MSTPTLPPLAPPAPGVGAYNKALAALLGVAGLLYVALKDGAVSVPEGASLALSLAGAVLVFAIRNRPTGVLRYAKSIAAFCTAAATLVPQYLAADAQLTPVAMAMGFLQVLVAAVVTVVPNIGAALEDVAEAMELGVLDVAEPEEAADGDDVVGEFGFTDLLPALRGDVLARLDAERTAAAAAVLPAQASAPASESAEPVTAGASVLEPEPAETPQPPIGGALVHLLGKKDGRHEA